MPERAHRPPARTGLAILREVSRIASMLPNPSMTELELELLLAHMPQLLREYLALREDELNTVITVAEEARCRPVPQVPKLRLVDGGEVTP